MQEVSRDFCHPVHRRPMLSRPHLRNGMSIRLIENEDQKVPVGRAACVDEDAIAGLSGASLPRDIPKIESLVISQWRQVNMPQEIWGTTNGRGNVSAILAE